MEKNLVYKGERLSFVKIFSEKKYKIVIPIIQRDYAQGRSNSSTKEVRNEFLDALYKYLDENIPNRDLDFVYGTLEKDEDGGRTHFIPLDGQQRLTTLFLLHWFLCQISDNVEAKSVFKSNLCENGKSLFTYETRQSSTDFCDALIKNDIDMGCLLLDPNDKEEKKLSLSETIKDQHWFFRIWNNDPTVKAMLVMLDDIYEKFGSRPEFFERLMNVEQPVITFIFMDLNEYKLTDDLYIKMNSRGKQLSKFENFKAKFEQYIGNLVKNDELAKKTKYKLKYASGEKEVDLRSYFSYNIDTKWLTLFWQYCKNGKEKRLDTYIENFIRVILTAHYASKVELAPKATTDATFNVLTNKEQNFQSLSFATYESTNALSAEAVICLIDSFDALSNGSSKIRHLISDDYKFYYNEDAIFDKAIHNNLSMNELIQFYAYVQFIIKNECNLTGIDEWMRVIHNLSNPDNSVIDGNNDMARGMKSVMSMLPYSSDIITYLQSHAISGFSTHQCAEECIKSKLVCRPQWKDKIEKVEQHNYFNGQIGFILDFAGILSHYSKDSSLKFSDEQDKEYLDNFVRYAKIASHIFLLNGDKRINDEDYCFERAVLTHGDYLLESTGNRWNLLSTETVARNVKRDLSWKRLLRINEKDSGIVKKQNFVKQAFDDISNIDDITGSFELQCKNNNTGSSWRDLLISSPKLIDICEKGFMLFDYCNVLLLGQWFTNMYHYELYTYNLWIKHPWETISSKLNAYYISVKTNTVIPYILLLLHYKRTEYRISIEACTNESYSLENFCIRFQFTNSKRSDYPDEIVELLKDMHFEVKGDNVYHWYSESEANTYNHVKKFVERLLVL